MKIVFFHTLKLSVLPEMLNSGQVSVLLTLAMHTASHNLVAEVIFKRSTTLTWVPVPIKSLQCAELVSTFTQIANHDSFTFSTSLHTLDLCNLFFKIFGPEPSTGNKVL